MFLSVPRKTTGSERLRLLRCCRSAGWMASSLLPPTIEGHAKAGEASLEPLLAAGATAVFCYKDTSAIGLLAACRRPGLSVPENLSIIGFDDIDMAAYTMPPLTTIRQPRFELGQRAMHMMLALLDGQKPENQVIPTELVVRQTTAQLLPGNNPGTAS